ncbi:MAG: M48 family metallopeptidase [Sulfitobacter sp.]
MTNSLTPRPETLEHFDANGSFYLDGDSPIPHQIELHIDHAARCLDILIEGGTLVQWPLGEIRQTRDMAGQAGTVLHWRADPTARLLLSNPTLLPHLPNRLKSAPPKGRARLAGWAVTAVAAVALQITVLVPFLADRLAVYIPPEGERALGDATFGQIRSALNDSGYEPLALCENPQGLATLEKMKTRLSGHLDLPQEVEIYVLDHPMVNAFALPGGYVVFFRGLIEAAETPEEVAAVLAHEIGHVAHRDPTRHAMRSAGSIGVLGLIFGDFAGGTAVLFLANQLIAAKYSQEAETGADVFAYSALEQANVSPAALGDMFERFREKYGDTEGIEAHFISHPTLGTRIQNAQDAARAGADYGPIVTAQEWQALQEVCPPRDASFPWDEMD